MNRSPAGQDHPSNTAHSAVICRDGFIRPRRDNSRPTDFGSSGKWVAIHERQWSKALLAALPFCFAAVEGSAGWSLCRSCLGHHEHSLRPWVDEARMAFPFLMRSGRCAPLSTGFGRWFRYWWMALRLSTRICRPPTKPLQKCCSRGSQEAPLICRMNPDFFTGSETGGRPAAQGPEFDEARYKATR